MMMKQTLCCLLQNRLGALDRLLGAFTYRGLVPDQFYSTLGNGGDTLQVVVTLEDIGEKPTEKLVKFLEKQVHVLEIHRMATGQSDEDAQDAEAASNVASLFAPSVMKRRMSHANS